VIDPDDQVLEDIEDNNVVSRTVQVLPDLPGTDLVAPHVDLLRINNGANTVHDPGVALHIQATDLVQPDQDASGLEQLKIVEFLFNESAGFWVPVGVSEWMAFVPDTTWTLHPQSGLHFVQAWASDAAGNVSRYAYQQQVNYNRSCAPVARDGVQVYRHDAAAGDIIYVELVSCQGDADLYVWPPDWDEGDPPWVSNLTGSATEVLSFTAPISGEYQVEVYGYTNATYSLQVEVQAGEALSRARFVTQGRSAKLVRTAPVVPPSDAPRSDVMSVNPPDPPRWYKNYLPLLIRAP
jgi:hypothetical protein